MAVLTKVLGEVLNIEIRLIKNDPELNKAVATKIGKSPDYVKTRMRYNVWTMKQFSELTGKHISTITNMTIRPIMQNGKAIMPLNFCYPFPDVTKGPKFIYRDERSMNYLLTHLV